MAKTTKTLSDLDAPQVAQSSYNDINATISVDGFLIGVVGRKVVLTISTTTISNDTETYAFSENGVALYSFKIIYTDGSRNTMISAERTV